MKRNSSIKFLWGVELSGWRGVLEVFFFEIPEQWQTLGAGLVEIRTAVQALQSKWETPPGRWRPPFLMWSAEETLVRTNNTWDPTKQLSENCKWHIVKEIRLFASLDECVFKGLWVFDVFANERLFHTPCRHTFTSYDDNESDVTVKFPKYAKVLDIENWLWCNIDVAIQRRRYFFWPRGKF